MPEQQQRLVQLPTRPMRYSASRPGVSRMTSSATATTGDSRMVIAIATK